MTALLLWLAVIAALLLAMAGWGRAQHPARMRRFGLRARQSERDERNPAIEG